MAPVPEILARCPQCQCSLTPIVFEHGSDAALWTEGQDGVLHANQAAATLFGYDQQELSSARLGELAPEIIDRLERAGEADSGTQETCCGTRDGRTVPVEATITQVRLEGRAFRCAFLRDISERRQLEEQLREAHKMEAVGRMVDGVAHDFNNLLTAIMIYSGLLVRQMTSQSPLRRHAEQINLAAERGKQLIGQLLDFSRRHPPESKAISLSDLVEGMREMLQRLLGEHIDLTVRCPSAIGVVHADPAQIEQVIMNLALNGRDAMPEGGKLRIEIAEVKVDENYARARPGLAAGPYVRLSVRDSGCGMDEASRSHAFEPFFTTKERGRGTGLGLSTVYGIVRQNGGHVDIDSQPGQGTTVSILLPRVADSAEPGSRRQRREREFSGSETVLLVEDEELVRRSIHEMLTHKGYHVLQARHGREALLIEGQYRGPIDLMVTDLVLPDINGRDLAERLLGSRPEMRLLFISGYGDDPRLQQLGEQGKAFFRKPFTPAALSQKVREVLAAAPAVTA